MTKKKTNPDIESFENKLNELKEIVDTMNSGEISLNESLAYFEKGVQLYRTCKDQLDHAELRVKMIVEAEEEYKEISFDSMGD